MKTRGIANEVILPMPPIPGMQGFILVLVGLALGAASWAQACTVFSDSQDGTVLAGRNWDMTECQPVMWSAPARGRSHGRICFGRHAGCEDGMNDQGLFVAVAATPASGSFEPGERPMWCPVALDLLLANCGTVDEAVAWWEEHRNPAINSTIFSAHLCQ
jgi:penicillin V acylase-like amidase (Ntn superfamily)